MTIDESTLRELAALTGAPRMNPKHPWTPDREDKLKVLWAQGLTCSQIAKQLGAGITRNAVIGKRIRLGLPDRITVTRAPRPVRAAKPAKRIFPKLKAEPIAKPRAPVRGPNSVRFIDRAPSQCPMFCAGEEGAQGFVCGEAVEFGTTWCENCVRLVYTPIPKRVAA